MSFTQTSLLVSRKAWIFLKVFRFVEEAWSGTGASILRLKVFCRVTAFLHKHFGMASSLQLFVPFLVRNLSFSSFRLYRLLNQPRSLLSSEGHLKTVQEVHAAVETKSKRLMSLRVSAFVWCWSWIFLDVIRSWASLWSLCFNVIVLFLCCLMTSTTFRQNHGLLTFLFLFLFSWIFIYLIFRLILCKKLKWGFI